MPTVVGTEARRSDLAEELIAVGTMMVPVFVWVDVAGRGKVTKAEMDWENTRPFRDDVRDEKPNYISHDEELDGKIVTDPEARKWLRTVYAQLQKWIEEEYLS
jgi:hypothetical protein